MQRSININHDENKILSAYDNKFFVKEKLNWVEKEDNIYKGYEEPNNNFGEDNEYYIKYNKIFNYLKYSENFSDEWYNFNNTIRIDTLKYPYNNCKKIIPNNRETQHYISYDFKNDYESYWCFSLYVKDVEYNNFRLSILDLDETSGVSATFTIAMNTQNNYITTKKIEKIGDSPNVIFDISCCDITKESDGFYRAFVSVKITDKDYLKCKFSILKPYLGELIDVFSNETSTSGIIINAAQLSKTKNPVNYIYTDGEIKNLDEYNSLYKKINGLWKKINNASLYYGNDIPSKTFGLMNDLYFINPIIEVGDNVKIIKNGSMIEPGCFFWNNINTYSYVSNDGKIYDLIIDNDEKRFKKIVYSILFSTNLFNESYNTEYSNPLIDCLYNQGSSLKPSSNNSQIKFGYNSGGHGNFWDYNRLRRYY